MLEAAVEFCRHITCVCIPYRHHDLLRRVVCRNFHGDPKNRNSPAFPEPFHLFRYVDEQVDDYMRGLYFGSRYTELGLQTAIAHFKRAIEKDSTFGSAYESKLDHILAHVRLLGWPRQIVRGFGSRG